MPKERRNESDAKKLAEEAERLASSGHDEAEEARFRKNLEGLFSGLSMAPDGKAWDGLAIVPIGYCQADAVLLVYRGCEDFLALGPQPKATMGMVMKDLEDSRRQGRTFCGIYDGRRGMVGIVDYSRRGQGGGKDRASLALLMIAKPHRGRGLGARVVEMVEREIAKDPAVVWIDSGVQVNNAPAIAFWRKMGYEVCGGPELMPDTTTVYHLRKKVGQPGKR